MKAVLISIQPKWCEKIASGEKTIEVRKSRPKIETPFKCYIYATKKEYLQHIFKKGEYIFSDDHSMGKFDENIFVKNKHDWQGKVIGEFICDEISEIGNYEEVDHMLMPWVKDWETTKKLCENACMRDSDISEYLGEKKGYGWHISNLKIYDKPKELRVFKKPCPHGEDMSCHLCEKSGYAPDMQLDCFNAITRPPQSWCYVDELEADND